MDIFAVRLNADPRNGRPYSAYPTKKQYQAIHGDAVGNGFHEAANFMEEEGKVRGYLPPKPSRDLQQSENFTLVSLTYKGKSHAPDRIFGIQTNCRFVGSTKRQNPHIRDLNWHYICNSEGSIVFPDGIPNAFASLISDDWRAWYRGGPTKRLDSARLLEFLSKVNESAVERRGLDRFQRLKSRLLGDASVDDQSFEDQVAAAMDSDLIGVTGNKSPTARQVVTKRYDRDWRVAALARRRANGKCDDCKQDAPFKSKRSGLPFLEVHHIDTLANGGPDTPENTIALCPNCHPKRHHG